MQFIDLGAQYKHLQEKIDGRIANVLAEGKYIMGPEVGELEDKLSAFVGVKHTISCANGTDALQLALMALEIKPGDAVFCPTFTFFATAEVISLLGATPVFVDVDAQTFNLCTDDLTNKIAQVKADEQFTPKAIIAVDLFGLPADYEKISKIAEQHQLKLIEDGAQGLGGNINGKRACSFGDIATTSFFPAKPLGCYGDGGAIFTNNDDYAAHIKSLRVHGKGKHKYDNVRIGLNSRLDTLQAAILLEKLEAFPQELENRNIAAKKYSEALSDKFQTPVVPEGFYSSWAQYTLIAEDRDAAMSKLQQADIPSAVYYQSCMHQQTAFAGSYLTETPYPVAEKHANSVFSLPMHGYLQDGDIQRVIDCLLS